MKTLRIVTYNIHKGFSQLGTRVSVHDQRAALHGLAADLVFLQEVHGQAANHARRHANWPAEPQYAYLAAAQWDDLAYGCNAEYANGHHGNALLSKFPIIHWDNEDISQSRFEHRGILHCEIAVPGWPDNLHCINVHLGLLGRWRKRQLVRLGERIESLVPAAAPLIVAGDFNDWTRRVSRAPQPALPLTEVFEHLLGRPARSYPAAWPLLHLDRIYVRGLRVESAAVHRDRRAARRSDHVALSAVLSRA